jgi:uncharacterized SAM-binding protein YcdF (DUF218 family)
MFFIFSKSVAFLLLPSNFLIGLGLAGVLLMATRWKRVGIGLATASVIMLATLGLLPVGDLLARPLEDRFPQWNGRGGAPHGIIVLGGNISSGLSHDRAEAVVVSGGARIVALLKLAHAYPEARIVYSGGDASVFGNGSAEASFVGPLLDSLGIPRNRVTLELRSRNTAENADFTKELVNPNPGERWLLVTSAQHMPRAVGCFRKVGFPVEAYPVGWRVEKQSDWLEPKMLSERLARLDSAVYEWIGLVAYWLTGRTSDLLPAPRGR